MAWKWHFSYERQKGRLKKAVKIICIVLVCIIAVYFLSRGIVSAVYKAKVKKEMELLIADGGSAHLADLAPKPIPKEKENPARLLTAAALVSTLNKKFDEAKKAGTIDFSDKEVPQETKIARAVYEFNKWGGAGLLEREGGSEWNDGRLPYLEKFLQEEETQIALELTKQGAEEGWGVFEVEWSKGFEALMPHLAEMRNHARLLRLEAYVLAKKGDIKGAMENVRLMFRIRRLIDNDPTLISKLVGIAIDSIACSTIGGILLQGSPDKEDVEKALQELKGREKSNRLTHAFLGEVAAGLQGFEAVDKNLEEARMILRQKPHLLHKLFFEVVWIRSLDEYNYLKKMRFLREASKREFPDALDEPGLEELETRMRPVYMNLLTNILTPALARALWAEARADASIRMARIALALSLYRSESGSYPDSLDVLVPKYLPEMQIDPFDGKPIRYKRKADGYILYSIDINRKDDGGVWTGKQKTSDWIWVMEK